MEQLSTPKSPLALIVSSGDKKIDPKAVTKVDNSKEEGLSFATLLLSKLSTKGTSSKESGELLNDKEILEAEADAQDLELAKLDAKPTIKSFLEMAIALKTSNTAVQFPTDNKKLMEVFQKESVLKEIKEAKNLGDLIKIAQKNGIEVKSLKIEGLSAELDLPIGTKQKEQVVEKKETKASSSEILNAIKETKNSKTPMLDKIDGSNSHESSETSTSKNSSLLSSLLTSTKDDKKTDKKIELKDDKKTEPSQLEIKTSKKVENKEDIELKVTQDSNKEEKNDKKIDLKVEKEVKKNELLIKQDIKVEEKEVKSELKVEKEVKKNELSIKQDIKVEEKEVKSELKVEKEVKVKETKDEEKKVETKTVKQTNEQVVTQNTNQTQKSDTITVQKNETTQPIAQNVASAQKASDKIAVDIENDSKKMKLEDLLKKSHEDKEMVSKDTKEDTNLFKNDTKEAKQTSGLSSKIFEAKQTLSSFAQELKERIEEYKPPLMKIKMNLNPKNLGDVDVTIINRGNNLQVTVSSNSTSMAVFTQNMGEFKTSLINMGFGDVNLNFNMNGQSEQQKDQNQKNAKVAYEESEEESEDIQSIEITVPRYV